MTDTPKLRDAEPDPEEEVDVDVDALTPADYLPPQGTKGCPLGADPFSAPIPSTRLPEEAQDA